MARRVVAALSGAIAVLRSTVSSGALATGFRAHVPAAWRRPRRLALAAAMLAVIVLIIVTRPGARHPPPPGTTVFQVGNRVVLRFVHSTGSVHLIAGPAGQVSIAEHRSGMADAIHTNYRQHKDVITVDVSVENGLPEATWVDFDVAVPQKTNAQVAVPAGTLSAVGLAGDFVLHDSSGAISVTNVSGTLALQTTSGSIATNQVSGQVSAITGNGTITASSTRLSGRSVVQARSGTINFRGSLDPGCHAAFRNTNGAIGVTLPRGSSAVVDARTLQGSINSGFPSLHVASNSDGRIADGRVGQGAAARLSIETIGGSINLNHGS